jgi:hypothetical protein
MSKEVAHQVELILRELITEFDLSGSDSQEVIDKVRDAKRFISSLDAARKSKGVANPFAPVEFKEEDINAID